MRRAFAASLLAVLLCGAASASDGCTASTVACNVPVRAHLLAGCHDQFRFDSVGEYVRAILYPLSPSLTDTTLTFDGPTAPLITGGRGGAITYVTASGARTLTVGSRNGAAEGDYIVALSCNGVPYAGASKDSTDQYISCGQTVEWNLTPDSGTFTNRPDLPFASVIFHGAAGDVISGEVESSDFEPRFGLYERVRFGSPFVLSTPVARSKDALELKLPYSGIYDIVVRPRVIPGYGRFKLTVHDCQSPACLPPTLLREPADVVVPAGARATLSAEAIGLGTLRYVWSDRSSVLAPAVGEGQTFTTPPVTTTQWYAVTAITPCGAAESRVVAVRPERGRSRVARH